MLESSWPYEHNDKAKETNKLCKSYALLSTPSIAYHSMRPFWKLDIKQLNIWSTDMDTIACSLLISAAEVIPEFLKKVARADISCCKLIWTLSKLRASQNKIQNHVRWHASGDNLEEMITTFPRCTLTREATRSPGLDCTLYGCRNFKELVKRKLTQLAPLSPLQYITFIIEKNISASCEPNADDEITGSSNERWAWLLPQKF